uniref:Uncharacterized protein n=1 Tax=Magallana gigas TaxID=29159 RepID=A0A8W8LY13_MAGGI
MLLQEQNFLARERKKSDREEELERQLRQLREDQLRKMYELQNEINLLKNRPPVEATPRQVLPPPPRPYVEVEPMAPYDQYVVWSSRDGVPLYPSLIIQTPRVLKSTFSTAPNRYVPTNHHTWVSTQHYYNGDISTRLPPPTARPESEGTNVDDLD